MKRKAALGTGILTMVLCLAMGFTAYAQGWEQDGNGWWYSTDSGYLSNGFSQIDGKWYYFSPVGAGVYAYDPAKQQWIYGGGTGRPLGSMYKNEITPDGYQTDADGAWIQ